MDKVAKKRGGFDSSFSASRAGDVDSETRSAHKKIENHDFDGDH